MSLCYNSILYNITNFEIKSNCVTSCIDSLADWAVLLALSIMLLVFSYYQHNKINMYNKLLKLRKIINFVFIKILN